MTHFAVKIQNKRSELIKNVDLKIKIVVTI